MRWRPATSRAASNERGGDVHNYAIQALPFKLIGQFIPSSMSALVILISCSTHVRVPESIMVVEKEITMIKPIRNYMGSQIWI